MLPTNPRPRASAVALAALLAASVAACSAEEGSSSAGGDGGGDGITVQTAQYSWTAAGLTNGILSEIAADNPDLGVASWRPRSSTPPRPGPERSAATSTS
jgi:glycine betaine/proline transport system substrate-binding protein